MTILDFWDWVDSEIADRGLSYHRIEQETGLSNAALYKPAHNRTEPTLLICKALAQAFDMPTEMILRRAGHLPPLPAEVEEEQEVIIALRTMPASDREAAVKMFRGLCAAKTATPDDVELTITPAQERQPQTLEERAAAALLDEMEGLTEDEQDEVFRFMKWVRDRRAGVAGATEHVR